jgi:hypothetical protein
MFQVIYLAPILLFLLFLVAFLRQPAPEGGLVLVVLAGLALLTVPRALTRVTVNGEKLVRAVPLRRPRTVYLRQLVAVERSSRLGHALLLRYHPMDEQGRVDIANEEFLGLVPLDDQFALEDRLQVVVGD